METYLITRPSLAARVMQLGHDVVMLPSPYKPNMTVWEVELTVEIADLIRDYYHSIGLSAPVKIINYLEEHDG